MSTSALDRETLVKTVALLRPSLATQNYIPALTHIRFDGVHATAYNDISAIQVKSPLDLKRCVPGETLYKALAAFKGASVALTYDDKDSSLLVSSGRARIKLPTLPNEDFPFDMPTDAAPEVPLTADMLTAITRCLISVGTDQTHPAAMGITMEIGDHGKAVFYSTDDKTISRASTSSDITLPGGAPLILPTFFCERLIALSKAFPQEQPVLVMLPGAVLAEFGGEALVFTKTLTDDIEPLDFERMLRKHVQFSRVPSELVDIPDMLDAALGRALLVLGNAAEPTTKMDVSAVSLVMSTTSALGDADDEMAFNNNQLPGFDGTFLVDPGTVERGAKVTTKMAFYKRVLLLANSDASFMHFISHVTK